MKLTGDPANTLAILVGIEKYADPAWPDLGGPAMDAMRIAEWLLGQGVAADRILLYINFGALTDPVLSAERVQLLQKLSQGGVPEPQAPTRAHLEDALNPRKFLPPPDGQPGLLLVYFSGHGLSSSKRKERYAIAADATSASLEVVNIGLHADNLRLQSNSCKYKQQWIIQDACAETLGNKRFLRTLAIDLPETSEAIEQYCLFAARPGQFAISNPATQAGDLTCELINVLQQQSLAALDIEHVFDALEKAFAGRTHQPSLTRIGADWSERTLSPGVTTAPDAKKALAAILNTLAISRNVIHGVFRQVTHTEEPPAGNMADLVAALDAYVKSDSLTNVELFAIRLAALCNRLGMDNMIVAPNDYPKYITAHQLLDKWVQTWANDAPAVVQEQERLLEAVRAASASPIIVLHPCADQETRAWRYCDGQSVEACSLAAPPPPLGASLASPLHQQIAKAIEQVGEHGWIVDNTVIELVLPLARLFDRYTGIEILLEPDLQISYRLGERRLVLVLRVEERWTKLPWHRSWQERWKQIKHQLTAMPQMCWLPSQPAAADESWKWMGALDHNEASFKKALYEGAPFAAWCAREDANNLEKKLTKWTYLDLHQLLQEIGALNGDGGNINCIVDDPNRLPPGASIINNALRQPTLRT